jgi:hypothetical protein
VQGGGSDDDEEAEPEPVPSFTEALHAFWVHESAHVCSRHHWRRPSKHR